MAGFEPRLPTKGAAPAAASPAFTPQAAPARGVGGWPTKAAASSPNAPQPAPVAQREAIRSRVSAPVQSQVVLHEDQTEQDHEIRGAAPATGRGFFSKAVQTAIAPETEQPQTEHILVGGDAVEVDVPQTEAPKPRAPRSRKTDIAPAAEMTKDEQTSSSYPSAPVAAWPNFSIHLNGLPPAAIKAALQAIVDNL